LPLDPTEGFALRLPYRFALRAHLSKLLDPPVLVV
jgi:hypothetical protein